MKFQDTFGEASFSDAIVSKLQYVIARSSVIYSQSSCKSGLDFISRSYDLLAKLSVDLSFLDQAKDFILQSSMINVVFHCPFIKNELPGTFYMPKLAQESVDRHAFISMLTCLHSELNSDLNPLTVLITTPEWYLRQFKNQSFSFSKIIPVFVNEEINYPMYSRHSAYIAVLVKLFSLTGTGSEKVLSFHDSDLLPIASWKQVVNHMLTQSFDLMFTYRYSPNLLPLNGGLFFAALTPKAVQLMKFSLGLYDELSLDPALTSIYPSNIKIWDGDQIILNTIYDWCNENPFEQLSPINQAKLGALPAWSMNHSVKRSVGDIVQDYREKGIKAIHLKGTAKQSLTCTMLKDIADKVLGCNN